MAKLAVSNYMSISVYSLSRLELLELGGMHEKNSNNGVAAMSSSASSSEQLGDIRKEFLKFFEDMGLLHAVERVLESSSIPGLPPALKEPESPKTDEIFKGLLVYVETRCSSEDVSSCFVQRLLAGGAEVAPSVTKKVTHVLYKEGKPSTFKKAVQRNIPVVNILWVVESLKVGKCLPIEKFIVEDPLYGRKPRKPRNQPMSPKTPEDFTRMLKRLKRMVKAKSEPKKSTTAFKRKLPPTHSLETPFKKQMFNENKLTDFPASSSVTLPGPLKAQKEIDKKVLGRKRLFALPNESQTKRLKGEKSPRNAGVVSSILFPSKHRDSLEDFQLPKSFMKKHRNSRTESGTKKYLNSAEPVLKSPVVLAKDSQDQVRKFSITIKSPLTSADNTVIRPITKTTAGDSKNEILKKCKAEQKISTLTVENPTDCNKCGIVFQTNTQSSTSSPSSVTKSNVLISEMPLITEEHYKTRTRDRNSMLEPDSPLANVEDMMAKSQKLASRITESAKTSGQDTIPRSRSANQAVQSVFKVSRTINGELGKPCTRRAVRLASQTESPIGDNFMLQTRLAHSTVDDFSTLVIPEEQGITCSRPRTRRSCQTIEPKSDTSLLKDREVHPKSDLESGTVTDINSLPFIVTTSCSLDDQGAVSAIVKKLGGFREGPEVGTGTTHLVCGVKKRTLNLLLAVVHGCWILPPKWVYESLEAGRWLEEDSFELADYYPAIKAYRQKRQQSALLSSVGPFFICPNSKIPAISLTTLIEAAGGKVVSSSRLSKIVVDAPREAAGLSKSKNCISSKWILDCIMEQEVLPKY